MIEHLVSLIYNVVFPFGPFGVFLAEMIEEIIVPIPSAMILLGSGFIFLKGQHFFSLDFLNTFMFTVVLPASLGLTLGSLIIYKLVFIFEKGFIEKFGKFLTISQLDIDNMNDRLNSGKFDEFFIVIARIIPIVPSVVLAVFCGLIKMPIKKYILLTFIGAFFRATLLSLIGFWAGNIFTKYADFISKIETTVFGVIAFSLVLFILYRKYYKKVIV